MSSIRNSATPNPFVGWQADRAAIRTIGHDLPRPEAGATTIVNALQHLH